MHQQIPPLDQCGIPSQMAQPLVLCPIQLVYDGHTNTHMMVRHNEEHIQGPSPLFLNVQNTPPWIQNQTQNVIYVQQTPNQMLPYIQPNMIHNPIFQTPYNFPQILPQESITPVLQLPTLIQKDTIQSQSANINYPSHHGLTQNPVVNMNYSGTSEKTSLIAQNHVKTETIQANQLNTIVKTETRLNDAENQVNSTVKSEMKPTIAQNQENTTPNAEMMPNLTPIQMKAKEKMPVLTNLLNQTLSKCDKKPVMHNQHVQTDFSIEKTNNNVANQGPQYNPINNAQENNEELNEIPQSNLIDTSKEHKTSNFYDQRHIRPIRPNINRNTEAPMHIKSNIQDTVNVRTIYRPILPKPIVRPYEFNGPNFVHPNFETLRTPDTMPQAMILPNCRVMTNHTFRNEDLNTLNNKTIEIHNTSISGGTITHGNINNNEKEINTKDSEKTIENSVTDQLTDKNTENKLNLKRIEEMNIQEYEPKEYKVPKEKKNKNDKGTQLNIKPIIENYLNEIQNSFYIKGTKKKEKVEQKNEKVELENEKVDRKEKVEKEINVKIDADKKISIVDKNNKDMNITNGVYILTHVLDGHVIQESNVAFPIHKPVKEKYTYEPYYYGDAADFKNDFEPLLPLKYLHILDKDNQAESTELEIEENKEDNPFLNLMKSTVEAWNMDQLSSHLTKHNWKETAVKLKEQEIDGESLLLVSEQQLIYIGVSEKHAELISDFVNKCD